MEPAMKLKIFITNTVVGKPQICLRVFHKGKLVHLK